MLCSVFIRVLAAAGMLMQNVLALHSTDTITSAGDNTRSGYMDNHNMDPNVIKSGTFNVIWRKKLLGNYNGFTEQIYAQPLVYTPEGQRQFIYVISQQNIAYRLDAITGEILASRQLLVPFFTSDLDGCNDVADLIGSTATGVIDPATGTWFVTTKTYKDQTKNTAQGLLNGRYYIHGLDVMTLESKPNFPISLEGVQADNAPWRSFQGGKHHQRPALMQVGEYIYAGFASHCVQYNFTGWVIGWHRTEGRLVAKHATEGGKETNGIGAGVWMSGGGLASDNPGRMFFATGNGYSSQLADDQVPGRQPPTALEEAVVNMAINSDGSLTVTDFFMPWEKRDLDGMDKDLGTSGFVLLQPKVFSTAKTKRIGCVAGKTGKLYFLDADNLGGYKMGPDRKDAVLQTIDMGGPVFASAGTYPHDGGYVYVTPVGHQTAAFKFGQNGAGYPTFTQVGVTSEPAAGRQGVGHSTITSMNGEPGTGILWVVDVDGANLRVYGAVPVNGILPTLALLNNVGQVKFSRPTFGNGKLYLTSHTGYVTAFGSPVNMPLNCSSPYDAGTVIIGNSSTTTITCRAKIPLTVDTIDAETKTHFSAFDYPTLPLTLAKDQAFTFKSNFTPKSTGPLSTNINLKTTNGGTEPYAVNSPIVIRGVARSLTPRLTTQPSVLSFAEVITGGAEGGKSLDFSLQNDGEAPLLIRNYSYSLDGSSGPFQPIFGGKAGAFTFGDLPAEGSAIPGNTAISTTVKFNPAKDGYFKVYLQIVTNGGTKNIGAFGSAGAAAKAVLEWQTANGTWVPFVKGVPFSFGNVPLGAQQFRKMRLRNEGGTTLTTTISKPPVSGSLAAVNALGSIAEGSQLAPNASEEATLICSPPKSQVNENSTVITALWVMNNNDPTFGKHEIEFSCFGASMQVGPLDPEGQGYFRYVGCYKDADPERQMDLLLYYSLTNENGQCQKDCAARPEGFTFAATEYEGECWCGRKLAKTKVPDTSCQYLCKGNFTQYCGGDGAHISLFADRRLYKPVPGTPISSTSSSISTSTKISNSTSTIISSSASTPISNSTKTSTSSSTISTSTSIGSPTPRPLYRPLFCITEPTMGRALSKDSTASPSMTNEKCQDYCTSKGYALSGTEYATECYCGNTLENGAAVGGGAGVCDMACGGNATQICGGNGALTGWNNTEIGKPRVPGVSLGASGFLSLGCYTEGLNERALAGNSTASDLMTVQLCIDFCKTGGAKYAGLEYSTECYCGTVIAATANKTNSGCDMVCGGDKFVYCGGGSRLNIYVAAGGNSTNSTTTTSSTPTLSSSSTRTSTVSGSPTGTGSLRFLHKKGILPRYVNQTTTPSTFSICTRTTAMYSIIPTGAAMLAPAPMPLANWQYLGCANDIPGRALTGASISNLMTIEKCQAFCQSNNYPLAGLEYGNECYCGDALQHTSVLGSQDATCNMSCSANSAQLCGGEDSLAVYNNTLYIPPIIVPEVSGYSSLGCWREGDTERALEGYTSTNANLTVEDCIMACQEDGATYAGVEYGNECYCGNSVSPESFKVNEDECSMVCAGDDKEICGGRNRLVLYQSQTPATNEPIACTPKIIIVEAPAPPPAPAPVPATPAPVPAPPAAPAPAPPAQVIRVVGDQQAVI